MPYYVVRWEPSVLHRRSFHFMNVTTGLHSPRFSPWQSNDALPRKSQPLVTCIPDKGALSLGSPQVASWFHLLEGSVPHPDYTYPRKGLPSFFSCPPASKLPWPRSTSDAKSATPDILVPAERSKHTPMLQAQLPDAPPGDDQGGSQLGVRLEKSFRVGSAMKRKCGGQE